jgi:putative transposase
MGEPQHVPQLSHGQFSFRRHPVLLVDLDKAECPRADPRAADEKSPERPSGGRLQFGMVAGFISERRPTSNRNPRPDCVGIRMEAAFCVEEALAKHGKPDIFNTDQGGQFTSLEFTRVLLDAKVAISMDGKGAWRDNFFVERLWRSVKYEEVYLRAYESVREARTSIGRYLAFYNAGRPHSSLDARTPDEAYFGLKETAMAA